MMTTLLKHEWLRTRGMLLTVAGGAVVVVAVGTLLAASGWAVVSVIGTMLAFGAALAVVPVVQVALAVDYWRSSYGRVGYFTQTLPIRGRRIYWAKLAWAWIVSLVAVVLTVALGLIAWPGIARGMDQPATDPLTALRDLWDVMTASATPGQLVIALALSLVMVLIWPVQYYFAASFGSEAPRNRLGAGGPVLTWFGLYIVTQVATAIGLFALPWAIGSTGDGLGIVSFNAWADMSSNTSEDVLPLGIIPPLVIIAALCLWRTVRSWDHKVSLA